MSRTFGLLVLVVGCGDGGGQESPDAPAPPADAAEYDFSCLDDVVPTTASDPAMVSGRIRNGDDTDPLVGITVDVIRESDGATLASAVTDANGAYSTSVSTGGLALEVSRRLTGTGFLTTRVYDKRILSAPQFLINLLFTSAESSTFASGFGVTEDPATGTVATVIRDCSNAQVEGAMIAVTPSPTDIGYLDNGVASPNLARTGSDGVAIAWGIPPGVVMVSVVHGTTAWRARPVVVEAGGLTLSFREP